jgi:hypothetical protein
MATSGAIKTTEHGRPPRGLNAVIASKQRGVVPDAENHFGVSRFGRLFAPSAESAPSDDSLQKLAAYMVAVLDTPKDGFDDEESAIPALYT